MRTWIPIVVLLLLLSTAGCAGGGGGLLPTAAPTLSRVSAGDGPDADSPRVAPPNSGVPPTWTPAPRPTQPPVLATRTPEAGEAPLVGASQGEVYEVVAGDTLAEIAERFGVDLARLATANGIGDTDAIEVGQLLLIPR